jgi:hypothetical protein
MSKTKSGSATDVLPGPVGWVLGWFRNRHPLARLGRMPVILGVLLLVGLSLQEYGYHGQYSLIKTVGVDSAPSVELAHEIKTHVMRMTADLVGEISGKPGENFDMQKDFDVARGQLRLARINASKNITYTDDAQHLHPSELEGELGVIKRLESEFEDFSTLATTARIFHERGDAANLAVLRSAYELVVNKMAPDTDALAAVNDAHLEAAFNQRNAIYHKCVYMLSAIGIAILGLLIYWQIFVVSRRFKTGISIALAAATVIVGVAFGYSTVIFHRADEQLRSLKEDAFDSVDALLDARASMQQARAVQALILLDPANAAEEQKRLDDVLNRIARFGNGANIDKIVAASQSGYKLDGDGVPFKIGGDPITNSVMTGALAKELNNVTWVGELSAAQNTLRAYGQWLNVWQQVQQAETQGQHGRAVRILSGNNPGEGRYQFNQVSDEQGNIGTLGKTLALNKQAEEELRDAAFASIRLIEYGAPVVALIVWLLVIIGVGGLRAGASPERAARRRGIVTA